MTTSNLDWIAFDWSNFQTLCIKIAESIFPDCNFDAHLKHGQEQEGIDLKSFSRKDGSVFTIQCKRVKALNVTTLNNIVTEFVNGDFGKIASHFIVATSADLQNKEMQNAITSHREQLNQNNGITFECWDVQNIETRLKNLWGIVAYYFSKLQADLFCYPQLHYAYSKNIQQVLHYIPRKITNLKNNDSAEDIRLHFFGRTLFDLPALFITDRLRTRHICLVADAYQGKSAYILQSAWALKEASARIVPLLVEVRQHNVQPLDTLLNTLYGSWQTIPFKDIVLFIDGLDEVPTDKFIEMIKHIGEFTKGYKPVSVVISCRKLFYNHYDVAKKLEGFDVYELYPLNGDDIENYIQSKLGDLTASFNSAINKTGVSGMLYHPFYLMNITEEYLKPPHQIPATKLKVIENFIDRSFKQSHGRQLQGSVSVKQESLQFKKTIQRFALALQLSGTNAFQDEEMQQLFTLPERVLLQHNSLVSVSGCSWSFTNALFQEHLAASLLANLSYDQIIELCTVGTDTKKLKTKWIQTISSLLSLLDFNTELFQKLLLFIKDDNIELIFQTESSKYSVEFKLQVLTILINRCITLDIRPMIVYEDVIGRFVDTASICTDYLLDGLINPAHTERVKIVCARIIKYGRLQDYQNEKFLAILFNELSTTTNGSYGGYLVEILEAFKIGDKELIEKLMGFEELNKSRDYRDRLYDLIITLGLVDHFYQYGIEGMTGHIKLHSGAQDNLEEFLLAADDKRNLSLLMQLANNKNQFPFSGYHSTYRKGFTEKLFEKLVTVFQRDPRIIVAIATFIKSLGKKYLRTDFKEVDAFLQKTNSHWLVVGLLINDIFNDQDWELGALITADSYDYVLFEYEEGNYDMRKLQNCFTGLRYLKKEEQANTFYQLCLAVTEGQIENRSESTKYFEFQELEKLKRKNDVKYIRSLAAFKKGLQNYFEAYGKKTIPENELYVDWENHLIRQKANSHFIYEYFLRWLRSGKKNVTLKECLKHLEHKENFEIFRAEEIKDYPYFDDASRKVMLPILEKYYLSALKEARFANCMWTEDDRFMWLTKEHRIGEIFEKFQFPTSEEYLLEFIWLDNGGTRSFEVAGTNNKVTKSQIVMKMLSLEGMEKLKKKVVENIRIGIKLESILGNHIALCKKLQITEAKDDILKFIQDAGRDSVNRLDATTTYLELGGDLDQIVKVYESMTDFNDYYFLHLTSQLHKIRPALVIKKGTESLRAAETQEEKKINIAQTLAELGDSEAFKYLVSLVSLNKKSPHHVQTGHPVSKIDTTIALIELEKISYLLLDPHYDDQKSFHDSAKSIIVEWLFALGAKSEKDMLQVIAFLDAAKEKLKDKYENYNDLNWYSNRILEEFRSSEKTVKSIDETIEIINALHTR
jgi:hypothetical protein